MRNLKYLLLSAVMLGMFSNWALGQETATLLGTVTDPSGSVVPNVTITITNTATGVTNSAATNDVGQYVFPGVQIGTYDVTATANGFKAHEAKKVVLNATDRLRMDFQMTVGAISETVIVEASALNVQTDSGEQSSLVNNKQITELSTKNRTIYSYATLTTGAANLNPDTQVPVPVVGRQAISASTVIVPATICTCSTAARTPTAAAQAVRAFCRPSMRSRRPRSSLPTTALNMDCLRAEPSVRLLSPAPINITPRPGSSSKTMLCRPGTTLTRRKVSSGITYSV